MPGDQSVLLLFSCASEQARDLLRDLQGESFDVGDELWQRGLFLAQEAIHLVEEVLWWAS